MPLFLFEFKKMLRSKLLLFFMLLFVLLPIGMVLLCSSLFIPSKNFLIENCESLVSQYEEKVPFFDEEIQKFKDDKVTTARLKKIILYNTEQESIYRDMLEALQTEDRAKYLDSCIRENESDLGGMNAGHLQGVSRVEIKGNLRLYGYMKEHNVEPLFTEYDINFVNLFTIFMKNIYPVLFPILIILISTSFSGDFKNHTIKFIGQQPFSRTRIFISKYASANLIIFLAFVLFGLLLFVLSCIAGGPGSLDYPAEDITADGGEPAFITAGTFFLRALVLFFANTVLLSSIGLMLSLLIKSGVICSLLCAIIAFLPVVIKNPYTNVANILISDSYLIYIAVSLAGAILLLLVGTFTFKKKDLFG